MSVVLVTGCSSGIGEDAKRLGAGRQRLTDEEQVAGGRDMPDAESLDLLRRRSGFEW